MVWSHATMESVRIVTCHEEEVLECHGEGVKGKGWLPVRHRLRGFYIIIKGVIDCNRCSSAQKKSLRSKVCL